MAVSPFAVPMEFAGLQASFLTKLYKNVVDVSMQFGNLNVTASRKLLEESTAAATKAMTLKTPWDTQAFLLEQSQLAVERARGYRQNVQDIVASVRSDLMASAEAPASSKASQQTAQAAAAQGEEQMENTHAASHPHPYEVDPHPSALVEKMISSAVSDADATRH